MSKTLKDSLKHLILRTAFAPPVVRHCSQTIYETLLGCCRLWEATGDENWKVRADSALEILLSIQRPDGGFDIGYDFNFGRMHKKGQSTSPELVGLVALCTYGKLFGHERVKEPAAKAAAWVKRHAQVQDDGTVAIPYSPHTINEVVVYNGTSFACGALGCFLGEFGDDEDLHRVYSGMVRYLDKVMSVDKNLPGRFWYYCDQSRNDWDERRRVKIDYYHQMQQVEMHALAQKACPLDEQIAVIQDAADHIVALCEAHPVLPYTNDDIYFKGQIHLWGLSSVIPGMLEAADLIPERASAYRDTARNIAQWLIDNGWQGDRFSDILLPDGTPATPSWYMVRSDAWVFNALAGAQLHLGDGPWTDVLDPCYAKMAAADFSGPESHASSIRRRVSGKLVLLAKKILGK